MQLDERRKRTAKASEANAQKIATAVLYLRVSTKEQAEKGGETEGFSIPAQRDACKRKAESLEAVIEDEFVDRGESARSTKRPELQRMLRFVRDNQIDYVVVHKLDRLARNLHDHVTIIAALDEAGVDLVSCAESIDNSPTGKLLRTMLAGMAQFYSDNLATEVIKGSVEKAKLGGTIGKAPLGYRNVREYDERGREYRTVALDPDRAPLIKWAFETYATGDWPIERLLEELTRRGLTNTPTATRPARPLYYSHLHKLLRHPYYKGIVRYLGVEYEGKHPRLIDDTTWQRVQDVLTSRNNSLERQRIHNHYLKGSLWCGKKGADGKPCGGRMIVCNAGSRSGRVYPYFVCLNRHAKRTACTFKAVLIDLVEEKVIEEYGNHQLTPAERDELEAALNEELQALRDEASTERELLLKQERQLLHEQEKLLQAHYAEAVPIELFRREQDRIGKGITHIRQRLAVTDREFDQIAKHLAAALDLATNVQDTYADASNPIRRRLNQSLFKALRVEENGEVVGELAPPFDTILSPEAKRLASARACQRPAEASEADWVAWEATWNANGAQEILSAVGLNSELMVGAGGFEPP